MCTLIVLFSVVFFATELGWNFQAWVLVWQWIRTAARQDRVEIGPLLYHIRYEASLLFKLFFHKHQTLSISAVRSSEILYVINGWGDENEEINERKKDRKESRKTLTKLGLGDEKERKLAIRIPLAKTRKAENMAIFPPRLRLLQRGWC